MNGEGDELRALIEAAFHGGRSPPVQLAGRRERLARALLPELRGATRAALFYHRSAFMRYGEMPDVEHFVGLVWEALDRHDGKALRAWDPLVGPLGPLVRRIASNVVIDELRRRRVRRVVEPTDPADLDELHRYQDGDPDTQLVANESAEQLRQEIYARASAREIEAFELHYVRGLDVKDVAALLGKSAAAISTALLCLRARVEKLVRKRRSYNASAPDAAPPSSGRRPNHAATSAQPKPADGCQPSKKRGEGR